MEEKFDVTGMTCAACQANVTRVVSKLDGVSHCDVSLLSNSMKVEFDQDKVNEQVICEAVKQIGYGASVHGEKGEVKKEWQNRQNRVESDQRSAKQRLILSLVLLIPCDCDGTYGRSSNSRGYGMDDGFSFNTVDSMSIYIIYSKTFLYYGI